MKIIFIVALVIMTLQAGCTKSCAEKHWFDGRAFTECLRVADKNDWTRRLQISSQSHGLMTMAGMRNLNYRFFKLFLALSQVLEFTKSRHLILLKPSQFSSNFHFKLHTKDRLTTTRPNLIWVFKVLVRTRIILHLQMQTFAFKWMSSSQFLIDINPQSRSLWSAYEAFIDLN